MAYDGWLSLGGAEVVNRERTLAYASSFLPGLMLGDCSSCRGLHAALDDAPYVSPAVDDAPWYDPNDAVSGRFYGLFPLSFTGFEDSTRTGTAVEATDTGGTVTGLRDASREMLVDGVMVAQDDEALAYGMAWLRSVLRGSACTSSVTCEGDDLCYFAACPPSEPEWTETGVNLTHNPAMNAIGGERVVSQNRIWNPRFVGPGTSGFGWFGQGSYTSSGGILTETFSAAATNRTLAQSKTFAVQVGQKWTHSIKVKVVSAAGTRKFRVYAPSSAGTWQVASVDLQPGDQTTLSLSFTADIATTYLLLAVDAVAAGDVYEISEPIASATAGPIAYFDGSFARDDPYLYRWEGNPDASTSTRFVQHLDGWTAVGGEAMASQRWANSADQSLRLTTRAASGSVVQVATESSGWLTPGTAFLARAVSHVEQSSQGAGPTLRFTVTGHPERTVEASAPDKPGDTPLSLLFTTPSDGSSYQLELVNPAPSGAPDVWFDDVTVQQTDYVVPWRRVLRTYRQVTVIGPPTVTQEFSPRAGAICKVEFILNAGVPWQYGYPALVGSVDVAGLQDEPPQATASDPFFMLDDGPLDPCVQPAVPLPVQDPLCDPIPTPPTYPFVDVGCPVTEPTSAFAAYISGSLVPLWSESVPVITLTTGSRAARGVRVRLLPQALPQQMPGDLDPCSSCLAFTVTYIPPSSSMVLDGMIERVVLSRPGGVLQAADHLLGRPTDGSDYGWTSLTCGTPYFLVVESAPGALDHVELSMVARR